jgi:hypothetical protein
MRDVGNRYCRLPNKTYFETLVTCAENRYSQQHHIQYIDRKRGEAVKV